MKGCIMISSQFSIFYNSQNVFQRLFQGVSPLSKLEYRIVALATPYMIQIPENMNVDQSQCPFFLQQAYPFLDCYMLTSHSNAVD